MYKINCVLVGVAPIMFNKPLAEAIESVDTGRTGGKKTVDQKVAEAYRKLHFTPDGFICMPDWNLKVSFIEGASMANLKEGRRGLGQYLKGSLFVAGAAIFDPKRKEPDGIDERPGRIPPGPKGAMAILRRPILKEGWRLPVSITITDDNRTPNRIREAIECAGLLAGLGAFRPQFGRFLVESFEVSK